MLIMDAKFGKAFAERLAQSTESAVTGGSHSSTPAVAGLPEEILE